jgi:hypothetical protein
MLFSFITFFLKIISKLFKILVRLFIINLFKKKIGILDIIKTVGKMRVNILESFNNNLAEKKAKAKLLQEKEMKTKTNDELLKIANSVSFIKKWAVNMELKERGGI